MIRSNVGTNHVRRCSSETLRFTTATSFFHTPKHLLPISIHSTIFSSAQKFSYASSQADLIPEYLPMHLVFPSLWHEYCTVNR